MQWFNKKVLISVVCSLLLLSSGIVYGKVSIPKNLTLTSLTLCVSSEEGEYRIKELTGACKPKESEITLKGEQGSVGPSGPAGPQGPKGDTGAVGPQGLTCPFGPMGPTGAKGDTGAQGVTGLIGPQGIKGDTGAVGPQGPTGNSGPKIIAGEVNSIGVILNGSGFTVESSSNKYVVKFPAGTWTHKPVVTVTAYDGTSEIYALAQTVPHIQDIAWSDLGIGSASIYINMLDVKRLSSEFSPVTLSRFSFIAVDPQAN
jgi:hypothetical protein